ncbi:MAG TPA: RNA polymerase sigma factor [Spirochaetota bacterium]|nr:RNA polymerase sigma factor [Spirochaetota bacterium]HPI89957.1 RNA polymerase sigma factor [Spirochaetota bacterium]HPR48444.1 RNA polymerase sigma factor [Spirochaetota bacterium]
MTEREFALIVHETKSVVLSAVEKHLAERFYHAIDDVVQETYLRAYKSLTGNRFRGDSALSTWLYTIARNESFRMNERLMREEKKFEKTVESIRETEPLSTVESGYEIEEFLGKIKLLPEKYRSVIDLVSQGLNETEIALRLSIKRGTVKSRISRGRQLLKKMYKEEQP